MSRWQIIAKLVQICGALATILDVVLRAVAALFLLAMLILALTKKAPEPEPDCGNRKAVYTEKK